MRSQPRRALHYRDEVWAALAELHSDEFAVSDDRKTPWFSLHRDMTRGACFLRGDKGLFELVEGAIAEVTAAEVAAVPDVKEPRVWIFQARPKFYRILEALQHLDRMQFLTNRYKDHIHIGDIVMLWMSGNHAGIYAQVRVVEGVADRKSDGDDAAFWADASNGAATKPRVVLAIEKRSLGNPLLKTTIAARKGLANLMIIRQANGTSFPVDADAWELLRPLLPIEETHEPAREVRTWAMKRARAGKIYDESCNEMLERYVADGDEHSRDEITSWFTANYPPFKPITVQCHIEKYTTNFRSRVQYNATPEHDLLFRIDDWARLRLYRPGDDPPPIHHKPDAPKPSKGKTSKVKQVSPLDRNRRLLAHLATLGELTPGDLEDLGLHEAHLSDWLDSLLASRPEAHVVTPLFLHLIDGDAGPSAFTTRLAAHFMGEHLRRHAPEPIPELEEHVWARLGRWHLTQPHGGDQNARNYVVAGLPLCRHGEWEPAATLGREAAAERLFQHPVAAALLQFEVHRLFAGLAGDVAALIHVGGDVAHLELDGAGRGPLWRHARSMLEQVGYWPVEASTQDSLWAGAAHVMLKNLELLDVFERDGDVLRLTDDYQSKIKAHPGHLQNRGEKPYRVRLSQFLATFHGGQA
ncbi:EVE domain-containing protein [Streptomyces anulatus]|uniref:EVE domain-containing protein n=1 Tax=Streptomyces anulatus TaxID=1892 RepID=UPI0035E2E707